MVGPNVQALSGDVDLSIKLKDGKTLRGEFSSVNDSELTILRKGKQQVLAKDTIAEIHRLDRKAEKGKYAAIGAGIGTATGGGIGAVKASQTSDDGGIYTFQIRADARASCDCAWEQGERSHTRGNLRVDS